MNNVTGAKDLSKLARLPRMTRARAAANTGALVGKRIEKKFNGVTYSGEVVRFDENCGKDGFYHIEYEDGDEEDLSPDEVIAYIKTGNTAMSNAAKTTGKRKSADTATMLPMLAPSLQPQSVKRARTANEPDSMPKQPRGAGTVKVGWKLRKKFPGHGPSF